MTLQEIVRKHGGSYVIAWPKRRDPETKRVLSWTVLQTARQPEKLKGLLGYYQLEGFDGVVPINCYAENDFRGKNFPPDMAARFFRSYLGMEGGT